MTRRQPLTDPPRSLALSDGRTLTWTTWGAPAGTPVLLLHGMPGSRLQLAGTAAQADAAGVRAVSLDRPGYGGSSPRPPTGFGDLRPDVEALLDHLRIERIAVIAVSGGGGFGLALAAGLPARVTRLAVVGGFLPPDADDLAAMSTRNRALFRIGRHAPGAYGLASRLAARAAARPGSALHRRTAAGLPPADQAVLADPAVQAVAAADAALLHRTGAAAAAAELAVYARAALPDVAAITVPVRIEHGIEDANVPITMARRAAAAIPDAQLVERPGDGHLFPLRDLDGALRWAAGRG